MGAGIAEVSIAKGYKVLLKDVNNTYLGRGLDQVQKNLQTAVKKKKMSKFALYLISFSHLILSCHSFTANKTLSNIVALTDSDNWKQVHHHPFLFPTLHYSGLFQFYAKADIVIEAVPEKIELKHTVFKLSWAHFKAC